MHQEIFIQDISKIVAQASSLYERLNNKYVRIDLSKIDRNLANQRLEHWCRVVAQGDWVKFQKRLEWDDLSMDMVRTVLGGLPVLNCSVLPSWSETLQNIIQTAKDFDFKSSEATLIPTDPMEPLPFEHILLPAIIVARRKLLDYLKINGLLTNFPPLELLSETAYLTLERSLLKHLVTICGKTLLEEFSKFRPAGYHLLHLLIGETAHNSNKGYYSSGQMN